MVDGKRKRHENPPLKEREIESTWEKEWDSKGSLKGSTHVDCIW